MGQSKFSKRITNKIKLLGKGPISVPFPGQERHSSPLVYDPYGHGLSINLRQNWYMIMIDITIEELIPHRNRMKLINKVIEIDGESAVTESIVTKQWPLFEDNSVDTIILIELVAQTAGVYIGWKEKKEEGNTSGKGWLVGIKKATFSLDKIPLNTRIIARSKRIFSFENFFEFLGIAKIGSDVIGEIVLQVFVRRDLDSGMNMQ